MGLAGALLILMFSAPAASAASATGDGQRIVISLSQEALTAYQGDAVSSKRP